MEPRGPLQASVASFLGRQAPVPIAYWSDWGPYLLCTLLRREKPHSLVEMEFYFLGRPARSLAATRIPTELLGLHLCPWVRIWTCCFVQKLSMRNWSETWAGNDFNWLLITEIADHMLRCVRHFIRCSDTSWRLALLLECMWVAFWCADSCVPVPHPRSPTKYRLESKFQSSCQTEFIGIWKRVGLFMKSVVFWDVMACSALKLNQHLETHRIQFKAMFPPSFTLISCSACFSTLKMDAVYFSETPLP
jgi:hypothetical protein